MASRKLELVKGSYVNIDVAKKLKEKIFPTRVVDGILIGEVYYGEYNDDELCIKTHIYDSEMNRAVKKDIEVYDQFKCGGQTAEYEAKIQGLANKLAKKIVLCFRVADGKVEKVTRG